MDPWPRVEDWSKPPFWMEVIIVTLLIIAGIIIVLYTIKNIYKCASKLPDLIARCYKWYVYRGSRQEYKDSSTSDAGDLQEVKVHLNQNHADPETVKVIHNSSDVC